MRTVNFAMATGVATYSLIMLTSAPSSAVAEAFGGAPAQEGGNGAPVCDAGAPQSVQCTGIPTTIQLDATGSFDPDGDPLTYMWEVNPCMIGDIDDPTSPTPTLSIDPSNSCLIECGEILLTVSDGQASSMCQTAVVLFDTDGPVLDVPDDVLVLWAGGAGVQTDPSETGLATAFDECTVNALVVFDDDVVPGIPPSGIEQVVTRTWTARDNCDNITVDTQTITIVGPSFFGSESLDLAPGTCTNPISIDESGSVLAVLLGRPGFDARDVDLRSLTLMRTDGLGAGVVRPVRAIVRDQGSPSESGLCHSQELDGVPDVVLRFDVDELSDVLQLDAEQDLSMLEVSLIGMAGGDEFFGKDVLQVRHGS